MAKADGKGARAEKVAFTRPAAERIAKVVREVEGGDRGAEPLTFRSPVFGAAGGQKVFRVCTFTGAWDKNTLKTITLKYQSGTPNTVSASNIFVNITSNTAARNCAIAREGTAWFLISAEC